MGTAWRRLAVSGSRRVAVLGLIGAVGATAAGGGTAALTAVRARAEGKPSAGQSSPAQNTLSAALAGLRTRAEALAERYDREVSLEQQAAAAYQAAQTRLAAARKSERRATAQLGQLAAAEYESDGGPNMAAAVFVGITDPRGYLGAIGLQQTVDDQRADLLAASQADAIVTRLFSQQAAGLLAQRRTAAQAAAFLKAAVAAAVGRQEATVRLAEASRSRLAASSSVVTRPAGVAASVLAGGPSGAAPGVFAPDWASDAGASAAQGDAAADWALTQLGRPYQWGAAGPGSYDCSGLAMEAWARAGVRLLHWTGYQWAAGPHVPLARLRRGDLVFYAFNIADPATIHHVGIYIGHGLMVDAPYTGSFVRIDSIYAFPGLIGATRPAA
jgi:cell wall-associated NlpC family hydrolase